MAILRFPNDFIWGVATSAQQIEGAWDRDGRGESVWDRFASKPGKIEDGSTPRDCCRHYDRWLEDIGMMSWLGVDAYRFSTSWSRIMPDGSGTPNTAGLDFYDRLVDALLAFRIEPHLTLNHWDMPQVLQDRGGWPSRDICTAFAEYTSAVSRRLGDRVRHWTTHNEPWCVATLGYEEGAHAPGHTNPGEALRASHHLLLSHGQAVEIIRSLSPGAEVGIVLNISPGRPASSSQEDQEAVRQFDGFFHRWYLDPLFHGRYPADAVRDRIQWGQLSGEDLPFVQNGDLECIHRPLDYVGVNYYSGIQLARGQDGRPRGVPAAPPEELTEMGWEVYPEGLTEALLRLHRDYGVKKLYVTENGAAFADPPPAGGWIEDPRRTGYLRDHLVAAHRAVTAGVPLQGYFAWSLLDNFEWNNGFTKRFGLLGVDFATGDRIPKSSAKWYKETIAARAVDDGIQQGAEDPASGD